MAKKVKKGKTKSTAKKPVKASKASPGKGKKVAPKKSKSPAKKAKDSVTKAVKKVAAKKGVKKVVKKTKPAAKAKPSPKAAKPVKKIADKKSVAKPVVKQAAVPVPSKSVKPVVSVAPAKVNPAVRPPLPQTVLPRRSKSNQPAKKKVIKEMIPLKMDIPEAKELAAKKLKPEPKGKFQIEYVVHASANILYEFLSTPSGLSEWFADDVNIRAGVYTFFWDGSQQPARIVNYKEPQFIRFQWAEKNDGSYFEFRIEKDELTGDISLIVTDFVADPAEQQTSKLLWDSQVGKLLQVLGSY